MNFPEISKLFSSFNVTVIELRLHRYGMLYRRYITSNMNLALLIEDIPHHKSRFKEVAEFTFSSDTILEYFIM